LPSSSAARPGDKKPTPENQDKAPQHAPVHLTVTLGLDLSIAGREGWELSEMSFNCRETFNCDVAQDLASASGLASANFRIKDVSPGMIVLDVEVMPDPFAPGKHILAAKDLANQAVNAASKLRSGKITSRTIGVEVRHCKALDVRAVASLRNAPAETNPGFCKRLLHAFLYLPNVPLYYMHHWRL